MDALTILTIFTILMLIGVLLTLFSHKIRVSNVLFLIITGLILGAINEKYELFEVSRTILVTLAIIALIMIVFDGTSRFKAKSVEEVSFPALRTHFWFLFFNVLLLTTTFSYLFLGEINFSTIIYGIIFSVLMAATDPASLFAMMKTKTNKVIEHLEFEAILNTPFTVLIPLIIVDLISPVGFSRVELFGAYMSQFLTQVLIAIGTGVTIGIIFFRGMRHYSEKLSPLALLTSAFLSYILAEHLQGSGILAVAVLGLMFGKMFVSKKELLQDFSGMVSSTLEILVFILLGFIISIELSMDFILKSLFIFFVLIISRYLAIKFSVRDFSNKEMWFMTLNMPKGIATAVLLFSLSIIGIPELDVIINLTILIIIYSVLLSTIINRYSQKFIRLKVED